MRSRDTGALTSAAAERALAARSTGSGRTARASSSSERLESGAWSSSSSEDTSLDRGCRPSTDMPARRPRQRAGRQARVAEPRATPRAGPSLSSGPSQ